MMTWLPGEGETSPPARKTERATTVGLLASLLTALTVAVCRVSWELVLLVCWSDKTFNIKTRKVSFTCPSVLWGGPHSGLERREMTGVLVLSLMTGERPRAWSAEDYHIKFYYHPLKIRDVADASSLMPLRHSLRHPTGGMSCLSLCLYGTRAFYDRFFLSRISSGPVRYHTHPHL